MSYSLNDLSYRCWEARIDELEKIKADIEEKIKNAIFCRDQWEKPQPDPLLGEER